jgi:hypothetical protein
LILVLAAIIVSRYWGIRQDTSPSRGNPTIPQSKTATANKVSLTVDFGDGRRTDYEASSWHKGMTIGDLLNDTLRFNVVQQGAGASRFLTQLGGVANEGAGGRNWTYTVNGQRGDRSFAIYELHAGDRVLWTFGPQQ